MESASVTVPLFILLVIAFIFTSVLFIRDIFYDDKLDEHNSEIESIKKRLLETEDRLLDAKMDLIDCRESMTRSEETLSKILSKILSKGPERKTFYFLRDIEPETLSLGMVENHRITVLKKDNYGSNITIGFLSAEANEHVFYLSHDSEHTRLFHIEFTSNSMIDDSKYKKYSTEISKWFNRTDIIKRLTED